MPIPVSNERAPSSGATHNIDSGDTGTHSHGGLNAEEASAEEDDDEDDIPRSDGSLPPAAPASRAATSNA